MRYLIPDNLQLFTYGTARKLPCKGCHAVKYISPIRKVLQAACAAPAPVVHCHLAIVQPLATCL